MPQSTNALLMVFPTTFGFDEQTAQTNAFQHTPGTAASNIKRQAQTEFRAFVQTLRQHNITVHVFRDHPLPTKPNAVFPNNWLSTWPDGRVYLYPMATESRRRERNPTVFNLLRRHHIVSDIHDLSTHEQRHVHLESTGVMVFDHTHQIVYGCISPRCDRQLFESHAFKLGYTPVPFHAYDTAGTPIYHTNVLMGIQSRTAVICAEAIPDAKERQQVVTMLTQTGHNVITITRAQMATFCGNILEVHNRTGQRFIVLSQAAHDHFTDEQRTSLERHAILLPMHIPTIETIGGGSARCMIAEIFLPALHSIKNSPSAEKVLTGY